MSATRAREPSRRRPARTRRLEPPPPAQEKYLEFLRHLGIRPDPYAFGLTPPPLDVPGLEAGKYVVFHPYSRWRTKLWPWRSYAEVAKILPETRFVNVGGDVRSPSRVQYTPDLTLLSTINSCGGFDEYADRRHVRIIRGGQVFQVDCVAASKVVGADPAVYPGDQITVPRTPF